jgi:hypothetical protein
MITVTAKLESDQFLLGENTYRVSASINSDLDIKERDGIVWTVFCTSQDKCQLFHSKSSESGVYLYYENSTNPLIEVSAPDDSSYDIKVKAKLMFHSDEVGVQNITLDENDNIVTTTEDKEVISIYEAESNTITLGDL